MSTLRAARPCGAWREQRARGDAMGSCCSAVRGMETRRGDGASERKLGALPDVPYPRRVNIGKRDGLLAVVLVALSLTWSAVAISHGTPLSRYDEWTYVDYAWKMAHGHIPVQGEDLADETLEAWSCRGMEGSIQSVYVPVCGARAEGRDIEEWPYRGENYNGFHPPLYFALAGYGGTFLASHFHTDFVTGARWISAFLVAGGVAALYLALRSWRASRRAAFAGALLALATPAVGASAGIVHNDAVTLLAGAAAVWIAARIFLDHRLGSAAPALVMAGIAATRVISVGALLAVLCAVGCAVIRPESFGFSLSDRRRLLRLLLVSVLALLLVYLLWSRWQNGRRPEDYVPAISGLSTVTLEEGGYDSVLASLMDGYGLTDPRSDFYLQPGVRSGVVKVWAAFLYLVYLVTPVVAIILLWSRRRHRGLVVATVAGPAVAAVAVQTREIVNSAAYFRIISGRYAISTVGLHVAVLALLTDRRGWRDVFLAFTGSGYLLMLGGTLLTSVG